MIVVLAKEGGRHTIDELLAGAGRRLRDVLTLWTYATLIERSTRGELPSGTYIFADLERLGDVPAVSSIWRALQGDPTRWRTLNQPGRTPRREALLTTLFAAGINDFRAWPATTPGPADVRFPVFIRVADDHAGARSVLLHDAAALARELEGLARSFDLGVLIVCEYAGHAAPDGTFVKFGAFVVDGEIVPRHRMVGPHWVVKSGEIVTPEVMHDEWVYVRQNPHAEALAQVARLAAIDYGRIDYGVGPDGRVRVWEINTNPNVCSFGLLALASRRDFHRMWLAHFETVLRALDARVASSPVRPTLVEHARWRRVRAMHPASSAWPIETRAWSLLDRLRRAARRR